MDNGQTDPVAYEIKTYGHWPSGFTLMERTPCQEWAELPDGFPRFVTTVIHRIQVKDRVHQKVADKVPIPGDNIEEAMAALPGLVKEVSAKLNSQMMLELSGKTLVLPGDPRFKR